QALHQPLHLLGVVVVPVDQRDALLGDAIQTLDAQRAALLLALLELTHEGAPVARIVRGRSTQLRHHSPTSFACLRYQSMVLSKPSSNETLASKPKRSRA